MARRAALSLAVLVGCGRIEFVPRDDAAPVASDARSCSFAPPVEIGVGAGPHAVAAVDLDRDGVLDLVVANADDATLSVLRGLGGGELAAAQTYPATQRPRHISGGDIDRDGYLDLVTSGNAGYIGVHLGAGDGTLRPVTEVALGGAAHKVLLHDLDGDGDLDVVATGDNMAFVLAGNGAGGFSPWTSHGVPDGARSAALADLDGDGRIDLVTGGGGNAVSVLRGSPAGVFEPTVAYAFGHTHEVATGDLDADGWIDVVSVSTAEHTASVLSGRGDGSLAPPLTYAVDTTPYDVATADLDGDGWLDIVTAGASEGTVTILWGSPDGWRRTDHPGGPGAAALAIADLDGDGMLDIVTGSYGSPSISIVRSVCL